jgi:hypothetical protein
MSGESIAADRVEGHTGGGSTWEASFTALRRTARATGVWYLVLAILGILGYLVVRPQVYVADDPAATLSNLVEREGLARLGLGLELGLVAVGAVLAVWFYKLFRRFNPGAAWAVAVFGIVNAVAIMASALFMAAALAVAGDAGLAPGGDVAATTQLMFELSSHSWGVGSLFFGLWLIPMGYAVITSKLMPIWLGRALIAGGAAYLVSVFLDYAIDAPTWLVEGLPFVATVGEFWMLGYLLLRGVRRPADEAASRW